MSVDFVARALAKQQAQSGQAQFTTLATGIPAVQIPAGVKIIQTSGYAAEGIGVGTYVNDPLATAALATAHPRFCKADAGGRCWRLLPDRQGLVPVACGGANGLAQMPIVYDKAAAFDNTSNGGFFSLNSATVSSAGQDTVLTAGGGYASMQQDATGYRRLHWVVKAGTSPYVFVQLWASAGPNGYAVFDPSAGTLISDSYCNASITSLGGGYHQIEVSGDITRFALGMADATYYTGTTVVGSTVHVRSLTVYETATFDWTDDRGAIQDAIHYCEAIGAAGTRFDAADYALWRTHRAPEAPYSLTTDKSGLLLRINKSHRFVSACGGTTLRRRDADGSAMGKAKFDIHASPSYYWRGGGIFVSGQATGTADPSINSIYLYDIVLDGGITDSSEQNNPYGPSMNADGDGWDVSDKGIWQENDRYCGDIVLEGRSGIRYFMGELIYSSGVGASVADRVIRIGPDVDLGHTCGSCLNANGATMRVERCHLHDAYMGVEGWTGHTGGYFKAVISDCNRNAIQGGIPHFGSGSYYAKTRPVTGVLPMGYVDLLLRNAGQFDVGSYLYGRIESIDCTPFLGNTVAFPTGCQDTDLEIITWTDQVTPSSAVGLLGGGSGSKTLDRVTLRVTSKRTDDAVANGRAAPKPLGIYGSFGPEVTVTVMNGNGIFIPDATIHDNLPRVIGSTPDIAAAALYYNIETNNNATIDLMAFGNSIALYGTNAGTYNVNLPTTGIPKGFRLFLRNFQANVSGAAVIARIPGSNFRGTDLLIPHNDYSFAAVEWDGYRWYVVIHP